MFKWYSPTLSEIIALNDSEQGKQTGFAAPQRAQAEQQWQGAIAALNRMLQQVMQADSDTVSQAPQGLFLSGPCPALDHPHLVANFSSWTFAPPPLHAKTRMPLQLLPASGEHHADNNSATATLLLLPDDPLILEQFSLVLTRDFSLVMTLGEDAAGAPAFLFSFDPQVVWQSWQALRSRLLVTGRHAIRQLDERVKQFAPVAPDYRTVMQFSRLLLANLPAVSEGEWAATADSPHAVEQITIPLMPSQLPFKVSQPPKRADVAAQAPQWQQVVARAKTSRDQASKSASDRPLQELAEETHSSDAELLQAIAHEVRTPLTTIRTLTRLLLKRKELSPDVIKRLGIIDRECTEQIDRFNLIFRAVELETAVTKHTPMSLAATSLAQVFQANIPRWQQQASQHNLTLEVLLPQKLPMVVSDPTMLDQMLTGIIDRITHSLPSGSHIQVRVMLAGNQLKLQFRSQPQADQMKPSNPVGVATSEWTPTLKSLGQLLMFQPETGNLSLNLSVTKNLFQALGGKMTVKNRPEQGEVLTIFLPLETRWIEE